MAASKKISSVEQYILNGKLRSEGFQKCRYSFCGKSVSSGKSKRFFVEYYFVNPSVSPNVPLIAGRTLGSSGNSANSSESAALLDNRYSSSEIVVRPSYFLVKAGVFGKNGRHISHFFAASSVVHDKASALITCENCVFSADSISGEILLSEESLLSCPEMLCDFGSVKWNLTFDKDIENPQTFGDSSRVWIPIGTNAKFAGNITIDGEEFSVESGDSYGFIDKEWGKKLPNPYLHLSSSGFTSIISGNVIEKSYLALNCENADSVCGIIEVDSYKFVLGKGVFSKVKETHSCSEIPNGEDENRFHWSISLTKSNLILDLDIFCKSSEMFVRSYEMPKGKKSILKVLGGGSGTGEIRIYRKIGKNLELLEHAKVIECLCDYGLHDELKS